MFRYRFLLMTFFIVMAVFSSCTSSSPSLSAPSLTSTQGNPTITLMSTLTANAAVRASSATVSGYYNAIKAQNYTLASLYLDADATTQQGQKLTQSTFTQLARTTDSQNGPLSDFSFLLVENDPSQAIMTITRTSGLHYHAHLKLKPEGNTWKVLMIDRI